MLPRHTSENKKKMTENFQNLKKGKAKQVQEAQRAPIRRNTKRPTSRPT